VAHVSIYWRLPSGSLQLIQNTLIRYYGLPDKVIDQEFALLSIPERERIGRRRQRNNRSRPKGEQVCIKCGETENLERHHLISPLLGGRNVQENLVWLCSECHAEYHREVEDDIRV